MFVLEALLQPISQEQPSGPDLRYDAITDQIREARTGEDESLPMGQWSRQTKRADYVLTETLASGALAKESKDLWFAAWLGEASLRLHGYAAIDAVFRLLLELQSSFWSSLHPVIEDGDVSLRAAPLHWAMREYASLIHVLPVTEDGIAYSLFHRLRAGAVSPEDENYLAPENIEASTSATSHRFYKEAEGALLRGRQTLEDLSRLCDKQYVDDGPSFVEVRAALEDVLNVHVQILRQKPGEEPVADSSETTPEDGFELSALRPLEPVPGEADRDTRTTRSQAKNVLLQIASWQDVQQSLQQCAEFCAHQEPGDVSGLFLALALERARRHDPGHESASPSSDMRLALKRSADAGDWEQLLRQALAALGTPAGTPWLDAYRYLQIAAAAFGAPELELMAVHLVRAYLGADPALREEVFEDGTPVVSRETENWIDSRVMPSAKDAERVDAASISLPMQVSAAKGPDALYEQASELARHGGLPDAARLLLEDASALRSERGSFLRRMELSRLLLQSGQASAANAILGGLLAVVDERELETWEDSGTIAELLAMHLQSSQGQADDEQRRAVFQRLCHVDPAFALSAQALV